MASHNLVTVVASGVGIKQKRIVSSSTTVDFLSVKVGATALEIKETTGNFDFSAKKLTNIASGTAAGEALSYSQRGAANGLASLDGAGKVPVSELPNSIMEFQGVWDASSNSPTLADGTGNTGDVYRVNTAGTQNLGSGAQTFVVGDWVMYSGAIWQKAHSGADAVVSVFSRSGVVTAANGDYTASQVTNVPAGNIAAVTVQAAIDELDSEKASTGYVDGKISDTAYAASWNGVTGIAPSKNAVYDEMELKLYISSFTDAAVTGKLITGYVSGAGTVLATDTILQAIQKLNGNISAVSGSETATFTNDNAGTITVRQAVYIKANGNVDLAQATVADLDTFDVGLVYDATILTTAAGAVTIKNGARVAGFSGLTPGAMCYVSRATAGAITQSLAGFVAGEFVYAVGRAISATEIVYDPKFILEY